MNYEDAVAEVVKQGAIRLSRVSGVWSIAYRIQQGEVQARNLLRRGENNWELKDHLVGSDEYYQKSGWYSVKHVPPTAKPIESDEAKKNPGYFINLHRRCETCKQDRPLNEFERNSIEEEGYRSWECNHCAKEREDGKKIYHADQGHRIGDYLDRKAHASRPPVESEI